MGGESDDCAMYVGMFCVVIHCGVEGYTMCVYCTMFFFMTCTTCLSFMWHEILVYI